MHKAVKPGVFLAGVLGVVALTVVLSIFKMSIAIAYRTFDVQATPVPVSQGPQALARGKHLARALGCITCHGSDLAGKMLIDDASVGTIAAPNLTRGVGGRDPGYGSVDFVRAVRHGVDPIGRGLWLMPSRAYASLSDSDLGDLLAYVNSMPPVDRGWPDVSLTLRGHAKVALKQLRLLDVAELPPPT